jgi:hypothetical protein
MFICYADEWLQTVNPIAHLVPRVISPLGPAVVIQHNHHQRYERERERERETKMQQVDRSSG